MSFPQQMISTPNSQEYAQLAENESYQALNPNDRQQYHMNFAGQGNQPIVQGVPVMIHPAYAGVAPMNNFEIYHPAKSPLEKLDSGVYVCYKYWVIVKICLAFVGIILLNVDYYKLSTPLSMLGFTLCSWEIFQLCLVFLGIREKNLEKLEKAVRLMNYYIWVFLVYDFFYSLVFMEPKIQQHFPGMPKDTKIRLNVYLALFGSSVDTLIWIGLVRYPAMKVRDILKAASTPLPHANINV